MVFDILGEGAAVLDGLNVNESEEPITVGNEGEVTGNVGAEDREIQEILTPPPNSARSSKIAAGNVKTGTSRPHSVISKVKCIL